MTIRVNVTQRDIERGQKNTIGSCPVARALRRHKTLGWANVSGDWIVTGTYPAIPLPLRVARFIRHFDDGYPVRPFTFDIEFVA